MRAWHSHLQEPHHRAGDGLRSGDPKSGDTKTPATMNLPDPPEEKSDCIKKS